MCAILHFKGYRVQCREHKVALLMEPLIIKSNIKTSVVRVTKLQIYIQIFPIFFTLIWGIGKC